ncbi:hypothetical protein N7488_009134 [Penicillium malachiteum]|nr:hypothetical protein N7488_009134 [Penicillium malachiteum]
MDPLTALELASNIVQFASELIKTVVELRRSSSGYTDHFLELDTLYGQLNDFNAELISGQENARRYLDGPGSKSDKKHSSLRSSNFIASLSIGLRKTLELQDIEELELRLQRTQMTMTLHICALASHTQEDHAARLTQLQSESNKLQFDQSVKIEKIMVALDEFRRYIESVQKTHPESPTPKEIMSLEQYLSELSLSQENIDIELAILKSLSFEARPVRHTSIPEAHQKTFRWAYNTDGNAPAAAAIFSEWLRRENGIFWVSGKPGSGKSTFMKFVADEPMTREYTLEWSKSKSTFLASHYFWSAGTAMQKS